MIGLRATEKLHYLSQIKKQNQQTCQLNYGASALRAVTMMSEMLEVFATSNSYALWERRKEK